MTQAVEQQKNFLYPVAKNPFVLRLNFRPLISLFCLFLAALVFIAALPVDSYAKSKSRSHSTRSHATKAQPKGNLKYAAFVIDADTGTVLHDADADAIRHPASLTKMMTLYMAFEGLKKGQLRLQQGLPVSAHAASMPQTNLALRTGDRITVEEVIKALVVRSANDAAVVMAEAIGKTEWQFAVMMTNKARSLGMSKTVFKNANGLPDIRQVTSARDMAKLGIALRRDFPQYYHFFKTIDFSYKGRSYHTHNHVLTDFPGADGLKTGYVNMSGYNLVTSVRRDGYSIVGVVMGGKTGRSRDAHMKDLLTRSLRQLASGKPPSKSNYASATPDEMGASAEKIAPVPVPKPGSARAQAASIAAAIEATAPVGKPAASNYEDPNPRRIAAKYGAAGTLAAPADNLPHGNLQSGQKSWGIQVGAFAESRDAFMAAVNAMNLANRELEGSEITVSDPADAGDRVYRARIARISEEQARRACRVIMAHQEACFVYQLDGRG